MTSPFEVDLLSFEEAQKEYPRLLTTADKMFPGMSAEDLAKVVSLTVGTCRSCSDAPRDCYCSRDD